jgi:hypothetical protein
VGTRFSGPGADTASCKMGTGSFKGVRCGRGVLLTTHPLLVPLGQNGPVTGSLYLLPINIFALDEYTHSTLVTCPYVYLEKASSRDN